MQPDQRFGYLGCGPHGHFFLVDSPRPIKRVFTPLNNLIDVAPRDPIKDVHLLRQRFLCLVKLKIAILYVGVDVHPQHLNNPSYIEIRICDGRDINKTKNNV